ncbi:MAG: FAD-dependent thymidylate synthase [Merismopedia sp. SIO2A8]|nr:FAD-dependent thymidylate synthase [Merismopedia sp. SIO2A8]
MGACAPAHYFGRKFSNLITLCKTCHEEIHHNHLEAEFAKSYQPIVKPQDWAPKPKPKGRKLKAHPVKVVRVEYLGLQETYDLAVEGPWHNFVANGLVVHNSFRYTGQRIVDVAKGDRTVEDVFYLRPEGKYDNRQGKKYEYTAEQRQADVQWCLDACQRYHQRINEGLAEEHARGLIPFDARQHFVLSCNTRSLMHLLDLRWKRDAQLEAQKFCELLFGHFETWSPAIAHWYQENRAKKARLSP